MEKRGYSWSGTCEEYVPSRGCVGKVFRSSKRATDRNATLGQDTWPISVRCEGKLWSKCTELEQSLLCKQRSTWLLQVVLSTLVSSHLLHKENLLNFSGGVFQGCATDLRSLWSIHFRRLNMMIVLSTTMKVVL
jgi:hypothetical protein